MVNGTKYDGELPAPWNAHAKDSERFRLGEIEMRLEFKRASVGELLAERRKIMHRCIKRMDRLREQK